MPYLGNNLLEIDVVADDGGVVATEFQGHALQSPAAALHDLLAGESRAGEADLVDTGVLGEHGAQVVAAAEDLDHAGREDAGSQLAELEATVRREGRGLPDEGVAGQQGGADLADAQQQRPVPRHDAATHAQRDVTHNHAALIRVLDDFLWNAQLGNLSEVAHGHDNLDGGCLRRLAGFLDE